MSDATKVYDLFVVGGGINGCGIARDAAGRGLSVMLAEQNDLASATSSSSTKLFHGGLRYLEYFEVRLVREALIERETLLRAMPHISRPMRFVLPYAPDMRFESGTPVSKILGVFMPWLKGRRPAWMIRLGLMMYDSLGGRKILPGTKRVDLKTDPAGTPLQDRFKSAYEYSDCWVDDARLVVLNARDAQARGATILTRQKVVEASRKDGLWQITIQDADTGVQSTHTAWVMVNAAGPWVGRTLRCIADSDSEEDVRLVRGSHIITKRLFDHDKCYFFQGRDGRIIFAIPYEQDFTLIGTTDADHADPDLKPECSEAEADYLCAFASEYFKRPITRDDIVWTYSGVRPLYDDGATSATAATRDYVLTLDKVGAAPLLNVFGGKITTYRRLAESALEKIGEVIPVSPDTWTAGVALPGGDFAHDGVDALQSALRKDYPFLTERWATRMIRNYGTEACSILGTARSTADLGRDFGATLTEAELIWLRDQEFARSGDDVLWRRSKLGLQMDKTAQTAVDDWFKETG